MYPKKLIGHYQCKYEVDQNHGSERGEDQNQKNDSDNGRIPFQVLSNTAANTGNHFISS